MQKENPLIAKFNYLKAVVRNNYCYFNEPQLRVLCKDLTSEEEYDDIIKYAKISRNWSEFRSILEEYLEVKNNGD